MRIFTSSWFEPLPADIQKIGISRGTPRGYPPGYKRMLELAPGPWFKTASVPEYRRLFFDLLSGLDPRQTVAKIEDLARGGDAALLCFEAPKDDARFCHRGYVSAWLSDALKIEVLEYGLEDRGGGWRHPKIPREYRLPDGNPCLPF